MITEREFDRALAYVRRTDLHTELEAKLRAGQGGRHRALGVDVLLAAMLLTSQHHHTLALTRVHKLLTAELSRHVQTRHRIRTDGDSLTIRQVRYLFGAITNLFEHTEARRPDMDSITRLEARDGLHRLMDRLTGAASTVIGPGDRFAIDATAIESPARGRRGNLDADLPDPDAERDDTFVEQELGVQAAGAAGPRRRRSFDPDARWGYRTRTYENKTNIMFGYQLVAFTRVGSVGEQGVPLLTERVRVMPGNDSRGLTEVFSVLDECTERRQPVKEVVADRGYTFAVTEDWAAPLAERGIAQVLDMHPSDQGARPDPTVGWVLIDGWPHVEGTPEHLINIPRPARFTVPALAKDATRFEKQRHEQELAELTRFSELIQERRRYAFEKYGRTKAGTQRWQAPGHAGKLRCPGNPATLRLGAHVPECVHPAGPPTSCTQTTVAVPARGIALKLAQHDYWGSPEWVRSFSRRPRVEGAFGLLKGARTGGLRRGWTHQVGLVKTSILLAIAVAAKNLARLIAWAKDTADERDPIALMDIAGHGFVEVDEHGAVIGDLPPPTTTAA